MVTFDRRRTRSHDPGEAVRLYLSANAARAGVRAAVLSDEAGRMIGGVGEADLEVLAAIGPLFVTGAPLSAALEPRVDDVVQNHDLYASALTVGTTRFVLTSIGARFPEQRRAERAFGRIFDGR